jgi:hypothetical protein
LCGLARRSESGGAEEEDGNLGPADSAYLAALSDRFARTSEIVTSGDKSFLLYIGKQVENTFMEISRVFALIQEELDNLDRIKSRNTVLLPSVNGAIAVLRDLQRRIEEDLEKD